MINIEFVLNDYFLISHLISNYDTQKFIPYVDFETKIKVRDFRNLAWDKNKELSRTIDGRTKLEMHVPNFADFTFVKLGVVLDSYYVDLIESDEYIVLKKQALEGLELCNAEWNKNFGMTNQYIKSLGITLDGTYKVWFTHPSVMVGRYLGNKNIAWTNQTYWENYNTVYIWHEILHSFFNFEDSEHALIELITDNHMRMLLNGTTYPPTIGHDNLKSLREDILPEFQKYIRNGDKDIKEFIKKLSK